MSWNFFSIFDINDGDTCTTLSDNMAMDSDGDIMMRISDNMAMDMDTGELHTISSCGFDDDDDW